MTGKELRGYAAIDGATARTLIADGHDHMAYVFAVSAANYANAALEVECVRDAPANTIRHNRMLLEQRIASTPHCGVCGGKIKRIKRHRNLVGFECSKCGRYAAWPQENVNEAKPVGEDAVVDVPVSGGEAGNEVVDVEGVA